MFVCFSMKTTNSKQVPLISRVVITLGLCNIKFSERLTFSNGVNTGSYLPVVWSLALK